MKYVTLAKNVQILGYRELQKGEKLEVIKHNKRYIYCKKPENECVVMQLTYKDIGKKSPIKRKKKQKKDLINDFLSGENVSFTAGK